MAVSLNSIAALGLSIMYNPSSSEDIFTSQTTTLQPDAAIINATIAVVNGKYWYIQ